MSGGGSVLLDRRSEALALERLIEAVRAGKSRALVLRGNAGVGKTALLDYLVERAASCRVVRTAGIQSEMELAFAAVHQFCAPMLEFVERLPGPQRDALCIAFGLSAGTAPDPFLVGLAVLSLLAEAARERPLLGVVDDAQWLDLASARVLAFVARRVVAESVGLVFSVRIEDPAASSWEVLPGLDIGGLPDDHARRLLRSTLRGPVDEQVLDRIVAESRGNPLALLELPRGLTPAELAGGFRPSGAVSLSSRIEESIRRQFQSLPPDTRWLLIIAAAEPVGDPVLLWQAAEMVGIGTDAATPAMATALLEIGGRVRFKHPLVRSAIYRAAFPEQLRTAHRALAAATDPEADPDRRAWHAALATPGRDDEVAEDLERAAGRAQARGGLTAAAAFLERATELTPDPLQRGQRALAAAQAKHQAGMSEASLRLLSLADASPLGKRQRAEVDLLRAQIAFTMNRGRDVPSLLLKAAAQLEPLDVRLARDTYLEALDAARFAAHLASDADLHEVAEVARAAAPSAPPSRAADLLLDGLAVRFTDGYAAAVPLLKQAVTAFRSPDLPREEGLRWLWLASTTCPDHLWDERTWEVLATRHVQLVRDSGALAVLPLALTSGIVMHTSLGELAAATALLEEQEAVLEATGIPLAWYGPLFLAAWQGREAKAFELIEAGLEENMRRGEGDGVIACGWVKALLCNSLGRYDEALAAAQQATDPAAEIGTPYWASLVELVMAAARAGRPDHATDAFQRLTRMTRASGTDWALGLEARCRALLTYGQAAERAYREAIDRLARTRVRGELARAHLYYGEWLRRQNRRVDARGQLRTAHQMFTAMGMAAFADHAASELAATGETVRKRKVVGTPSELTAQEAQIARLVREGLTNAEIATRLFISPRTVEWHVGKIFAKLQITSRRQLPR